MHRNKDGSGMGRSVTRRRFVQGVAAGAAVAAAGWSGLPAWGEAAVFEPKVLTGRHFELTIDYLPVNFTGRRAMAMAVNGSVPGPVLRWREGDDVTIAVTNRMKVPTSLHWHSLRIPADMDGVPGLSFAGIAPGETFHYHFPVKQNGTAWYHSHTRFQEQSGVHGALIIDPAGEDPIVSDREHVIFLSDWTDTNPETVFSNLKEQSDYYNYQKHTVPGFIRAADRHGFWRTVKDRLMWARMDMSPSDISDVSGATYTYLLNGNAPAANWTGLFKRREKVRLRFINGSAMTFFDVRIPGLKMTVVQADGNDVEPVTVDEFRIGVAERYDVIVEPEDERAYTIFAQSEDRTGYARGTLAPRAGMTAAVPPMDPRPERTMMDMGMSMGSMAGMAGMTDMKGIDGMNGMDRKMGKEKSSDSGKPMKMSGGMDMNMPMGHDMEPARKRMASIMKSAEMEMAGMPGMKMDGEMGRTPFPQPSPQTRPMVVVPEAELHAIEAKLKPSNPVKLHLGPEVGQVSQHVTSRLDSPGDGLDHNGRRVLTYADLRSRYGGVDGRPPTREVELHLTGNMNRYIWGFNGERFSNDNPIVLRLGERVRFVLINDTMMEHPIHLHGLWSELENGQGAHRPFKDTIIVKPSERVSYLVSADTPGRWAYHCHLLYHMQAGMFRAVVVLP
ncbi:MAG: copper resistance system multicopper oxidase [Acidobacteriaceae bacterium]